MVRAGAGVGDVGTVCRPLVDGGGNGEVAVERENFRLIP